MKALEVKNKAYCNKTINFSGYTIKFDQFGYTNQKEDVAKVLMDDFPDLIFPKGKVEKDAPEEFFEAGPYEAKIEELNDTIRKKDEQVRLLRNDLDIANKSVDSWKEEYTKLSKGEAGPETYKAELEQARKENKILETKIGLLGQTNNELIKSARALGISDDKTKGKQKEEIIDLLIEKMKDGEA